MTLIDRRLHPRCPFSAFHFASQEETARETDQIAATNICWFDIFRIYWTHAIEVDIWNIYLTQLWILYSIFHTKQLFYNISNINNIDNINTVVIRINIQGRATYEAFRPEMPLSWPIVSLLCPNIQSNNHGPYHHHHHLYD